MVDVVGLDVGAVVDVGLGDVVDHGDGVLVDLGVEVDGDLGAGGHVGERPGDGGAGVVDRRLGGVVVGRGGAGDVVGAGGHGVGDDHLGRGVGVVGVGDGVVDHVADLDGRAGGGVDGLVLVDGVGLHGCSVLVRDGEPVSGRCRGVGAIGSGLFEGVNDSLTTYVGGKITNRGGLLI